MPEPADGSPPAVKRLLGFLRSHIRALGVVGFAIYAAALLVVARYLSLPAWLAVGLALAGPGAAYGLAVLRRQFLPAAVSEVKDDVVIELNNWKAEVSDVLFRSTLTKDPPDAERVGPAARPPSNSMPSGCEHVGSQALARTLSRRPRFRSKRKTGSTNCHRGGFRMKSPRAQRPGCSSFNPLTRRTTFVGGSCSS